jgi:hypothetical protein
LVFDSKLTRLTAREGFISVFTGVTEHTRKVLRVICTKCLFYLNLNCLSALLYGLRLSESGQVILLQMPCMLRISAILRATQHCCLLKKSVIPEHKTFFHALCRLHQWSATCGPWTACGPRIFFMRPVLWFGN